MQQAGKASMLVFPDIFCWHHDLIFFNLFIYTCHSFIVFLLLHSVVCGLFWFFSFFFFFFSLELNAGQSAGTVTFLWFQQIIFSPDLEKWGKKECWRLHSVWSIHPAQSPVLLKLCVKCLPFTPTMRYTETAKTKRARKSAACLLWLLFIGKVTYVYMWLIHARKSSQEDLQIVCQVLFGIQNIF